MKLIYGDCLEKLKDLEENSIDSIVTDPPYELGFMGKSWDSTGIAYNIELWKECLRVLKPGGHLLAFSGTRTYHRMAVAIEDAGFEVRDMIEWVYGSGFPKSLNIGKVVDRLQGNEREVVGEDQSGSNRNCMAGDFTGGKYDLTKGTSEYEGWGTALKPAHEPICMARKPLAEKTVAENCLKWGTGGINIDISRVETEENITNHSRGSESAISKGKYGDSSEQETHQTEGQQLGRFPANLITDGSEEVRACFPETKSGGISKNYKQDSRFNVGEKGKGGNLNESNCFTDSGNASRFFKSIIYQAKASKSERNKGLDGSIQIHIIGVLLPNSSICESPDQNLVPLLDMELSPKNDTGEYLIQLKNEGDSNTTLFGKESFEKYLNECKSTIKIETNGTISQAILNLLHHYITKEYIADVKGEIEFGGSLAESVEGGKILKTTIKGQMEYLLGVKNAVSEMQLIIREKENKNFHSTVKPIALMEYLIKMVTPKGGIVLDPFAGSGSTLVAAKQNGFDYIGIEMTEEYIPIIEARLDAVEEKPLNLF